MRNVVRRAASIFLCLAVVLSFTPFMGGAEVYGAETVNIDTEDGFHYTNSGKIAGLSCDDDEVYLVGYDGDATELVIPDTVEYQGETYTVAGIMEEALVYTDAEYYEYWLDHDITSLTLPDTLRYIDQWAISNLGITELVIPESVTLIERHAINACLDLKTICVPSSRTGGADYYGEDCMGFYWNDDSQFVQNDGLVVYGMDIGEETDIQNWCQYYGVAFSVFPTPANPRWDGNTARWDKAGPEGTNCYSVDIYRNGKYVGRERCSTNSIDLTPVMKVKGRGTYTYTVVYYGSGLSEFSPGRNYNGAVNRYKITFDPGLGSGTMDPITEVEAGEPVVLPPCTFTAPSDDQDFNYWKFRDEDLVQGQTVTLERDEVVRAYWKNKTDPGIVYAAEVADITFPETPVDYEACPKTAVTIRNTGNHTLRDLHVTLSDDTKGAFILSGSDGATIGVDSDHTNYRVEAKPGLEIGTYTAKLTVTAEWLPEPVTANVSLTIRDHDWSTEWAWDDTSHWHPCLDPLCFARKDEGPHDTKVVVGASAPTFDTDGSTGDKYCSVCGKKVEDGQPIPAGKFIRMSTATTPVITDKLSVNDLVFISGDPAKYTITPPTVKDYTTDEVITGDTKFIAGREYGITIAFVPIDPYIYDEQHSTHGSKFYVNGQETDSVTEIDWSTGRHYRVVAQKAVTPAVSLSTTSYVYNGTVKKPAVTVKDGSTTLDPSQYDVTYGTGRKSVGKYSVKVTLKGDYYGSKTAYFTIRPKGTSIKTPTAGKKSITVKWNKQATKMSTSYITGYQIYAATDSKFTKNVKKVYVKKYSTTSKKLTGLKGGRKYYVKVRTYKTVGGVKYYSPWSKVKTIKTKK